MYFFIIIFLYFDDVVEDGYATTPNWYNLSQITAGIPMIQFQILGEGNDFAQVGPILVQYPAITRY